MGVSDGRLHVRAVVGKALGNEFGYSHAWLVGETPRVSGGNTI